MFGLDVSATCALGGSRYAVATCALAVSGVGYFYRRKTPEPDLHHPTPPWQTSDPTPLPPPWAESDPSRSPAPWALTYSRRPPLTEKGPV